jgi:hypothetical protein
MHEHYHEAFWVVAGTAAPVIALALAVTTSDLYGGGIVLPDRGPGKVLRTVGYIAYLAAAIDFVLMVALLGLSLGSLYAREDVLTPIVGLIAGLAGLLFVLFASIAAGFVRLITASLEEPPARDHRDRRRRIKRGLVYSSPVRRRPGRG